MVAHHTRVGAKLISFQKVRMIMKRKFTVLFTMVVVLAVFAAPAYPWGYGTHAYIADRVHKQEGDRNFNEIYGSLTPDMFNYSFDLPVYEPGGIYEQFHQSFLKIWEQKKKGMEKGLALGFVSHNDEWGADRTAHISSLTAGSQTGYVISKATLLGQVAPLPSDLNVPALVAEELYHTFIEYGLDIVTARLDPAIGWKISTAAVMRDDQFPVMLADAYALDFAPIFGSPQAAATVIGYAENEFRGTMILYGQILMQPEPVALVAISNYLAGFAMDYLSLYGVVLPPEMNVVSTIESYLVLAMQLCEDDYPVELNATVDFIESKMAEEGIGNSQYHGE
jgi:hypothetical protein